MAKPPLFFTFAVLISNEHGTERIMIPANTAAEARAIAARDVPGDRIASVKPVAYVAERGPGWWLTDPAGNTLLRAQPTREALLKLGHDGGWHVIEAAPLPTRRSYQCVLRKPTGRFSFIAVDVEDEPEAMRRAAAHEGVDEGDVLNVRLAVYLTPKDRGWVLRDYAGRKLTEVATKGWLRTLARANNWHVDEMNVPNF